MSSEVKLCVHVKFNGKRCRGIALVGKSYCRFHNRYYERHCVTNPDYEPPIFEDSRSIMMGIHELVRSRIKRHVDNRDLTAYMYAYQVAASMMSRPDAMAPDVAEPFEREPRSKAMARVPVTGKPSQAEGEKDRRTLLEYLLDGYDDYRQEVYNPNLAKRGLPLLERLPADRDVIFDTWINDFKLSEDFRNKCKDMYRRFPGDKWPEDTESTEAPIVDEGDDETSEVSTGSNSNVSC